MGGKTMAVSQDGNRWLSVWNCLEDDGKGKEVN